MAQAQPQTHSTVSEDYLIAIYRLQASGEQVVGARLAQQLGVAPPSVTEMLGRLRREGLVGTGRPVHLTETGRAVARALVNRHRLVERFLVDVLGLGWEEVHEEAHRLEHALSARVTERLPTSSGIPAPARTATPSSRTAPSSPSSTCGH